MTGLFRKSYYGLRKKPVQEFEAIQAEWVASTVFRMVGVTDLSCDQQLLLDMRAAVSSGCCPPNIAEMKPGPVLQPIWLTTATRVLRLYMSQSIPSTELQQLSEFIMRVYAPTWFAIKIAPTIAEGARHLWGVKKKVPVLTSRPTASGGRCHWSKRLFRPPGEYPNFYGV